MERKTKSTDDISPAEQKLNGAMEEMFDIIEHKHQSRFDEPGSRQANLEYDLLTTDWILQKARTCEVYAQNLYAAMCNNDFQKNDFLEKLKDSTWSCSWRYAGGIVADMRQEGDYIDWYCSGIRDTYQATENTNGRMEYVSESVVTDEIRSDLLKLGWKVISNND